MVTGLPGEIPNIALVREGQISWSLTGSTSQKPISAFSIANHSRASASRSSASTVSRAVTSR